MRPNKLRRENTGGWAVEGKKRFRLLIRAGLDRQMIRELKTMQKRFFGECASITSQKKIKPSEEGRAGL